jgi:hypothetical protein
MQGASMRPAVLLSSFLVSLSMALPVPAADAAHGARAAEPYRLIFTSSTPCRDPSEFTGQLQRRTNRLRPALGSEPAVTVLVDLVATADIVRGQLVVRAADGSLAVREVPGIDCHEVLSAMALIVALQVEDQPPAPPAPPRAPDTSASFGFGARVAATSGVVPGVSPGLGIYAEIGVERPALVSPSVRLTGLRTAATETAPDSTASTPDEVASADFELLAARLSACPLRWAPTDSIRARPCAFIEAGEFRARGINVVDPEPEQSVFWSATGVEVGVEVQPVAPLTLGAEAGILFPLIRDSFYFDPEGPGERVHEIGAVGWMAAVGAGLRFF